MKNWIRVADVANEIEKHACRIDLGKGDEQDAQECQRDLDVAQYLMTRLSF